MVFAMERTVTIDHRFRGPPDSGNGGYAAGVVAEGVDGVSVATLRVPPPLDTPMIVSGDGSESRLLDGDQLVAEAESAELELVVPTPPTLEEAAAGSRRFAVEGHIFPGCFVCGPERKTGDGLRIFPGPVEGTDLVASAWTPDTSLGETGRPIDRRYVWSALDCPSYFALGTAPLAVLGRITAAIDPLPVVGEEIIAMGWPMGVDGRKLYSGSALVTTEGRVLAKAAAVWIELKQEDT